MTVLDFPEPPGLVPAMAEKGHEEAAPV